MNRNSKILVAIATATGLLFIGKFVLLPFVIEVIEYQVFQAATFGDAKRVGRLLGLGLPINVNARYGGEGASALHRAAFHPNSNLTVDLVAHGADIDSKTKEGGETALQIASYYGNADVVRSLLERCANPHLQDNRYGNYALYDAVNKGHVDAAKLLLSYGADPDLRRVDGSTARPLLQVRGIAAEQPGPPKTCIPVNQHGSSGSLRVV